MKTLLAILTLTLVSAGAAHAEYSSNKLGKAVTCKGTEIVVKINAARTMITVIDAYDPGHPEVYDVVEHQSDGDTYVSYISLGEEVTLSFDDQGDNLVYATGGNTALPLQCPR